MIRKTGSMVQWVWTSRDKALFGTITRVNLTPSRYRLRSHVSTVLLLVVEELGEVDFAGQYFPVSQSSCSSISVMRERYYLVVVETEPRPMKEKKEKTEPKNETKQMRKL